MIGRTISHYEILEKLGEGGMGVVYKARDTKLDRIVAIKLLPPHMSSDPDAVKRFVHEAKTASAIDHQHIGTIYEIDETDDGSTFIVMAFYEGETLRERIDRDGITVTEALEIASQIASGLARAHEKGIVHRDVKPGNILIDDHGLVKIVDFGLAKLGSLTKMTVVGTTMGTVSYMSPEQARGDEVDHRSDIWALGVVLYEMVTGRVPFRGEYDQAVIYSILNIEPEPVISLRAGVPMELEGIIRKALSKDHEGRYQRMEDIRSDLESFLDKAPLNPDKDGFAEREPSIAVLPFVNISADPENEYFSDGLAEELINALTRLKGLRVVARTSAFRFKGKETDIREIGRQLDVGSILEGSVRKSGNRLRITVQLINVDDGYHIWSDRFDRELEDIFDIQDEIARAVVDKLEVTLSLKPGKPIVKQYTDDFDAYSLYLKGLYNWNLMTPESWILSRECLEKAVAIDPDFAPAYAGLAVWYQSQAYWGEMRPVEAYEKSMENAKRALAIDEEMSMVHNVLACNYFLLDWARELRAAPGPQRSDQRCSGTARYRSTIRSVFRHSEYMGSPDTVLRREGRGSDIAVARNHRDGIRALAAALSSGQCVSRSIPPGGSIGGSGESL
jgi:serine/threonine protein kinase